MKKIFTVGFVALILSACGDNSGTTNNNQADTSKPVSTEAPIDAGANRKDTSMYQRMPNKTSDSTPH